MKSWPTLRLLLRRFTLRHWRLAPRAVALQVFILALGIAVFFSIRLANRAAVISFDNFTGLLAQQSDWQITAPAGLLPVAVLTEIRAALGDEAVDMIPIVETTAAKPRGPGEEPIGSRQQFSVLGLDLVAVANLATADSADRGWLDQSPTGTNVVGGLRFWKLLRQPNAVFISPALAKKLKLNVGDEFRVVLDENIFALEVVGLIPVSPARPAPPENLLVMDLPKLQRLAHREDRLDRVEFIVPGGLAAEARRGALREKLAALGQGRWEVFSPADRRAGAQVMTQAFRMNLTILSLVGLLVGLYLIFQSLDGAVVRRREEIGVLRSLGVSEKLIRRAWLCEAALLGLAGGVFGALLGWGGAQLAVRLVGRTVNALYYATTVDSAHLELGEFCTALALAVTASLVAGWWPAWQAAKIAPAQMLSRHGDSQERKTILQSTPFAVALLVVAALLVWMPPLRLSGALRFPLGGYAASLALIFGMGIFCGLALRRSGEAIRWAGRYFIIARLAAGHLAKCSSRHRLAAGGLVCAVTMAAGMMILVTSFETTMRGWIERTFQADLFIASDGAQSASTQSRISPATWRAVMADPAVAEVNVMQSAPVTIGGVSTVLVGADLEFCRRHPNLIWHRPPTDDKVFNFADNARLGVISESFADRFRVGVGDTVTLPTPTGAKTVSIAGIFSDYGNERGSLLVERRHFSAWFGDELATSLIVFLKPDANPESVRQELAAQFPGLSVLTNRYLRGEVLRIFRQTFSVTYALELIGIIVAVIGLGMTLWSILLDRRGELTTLRALGLRHDELAQATALEGALLALGGVFGGLAASVGLGWILIYVINKQSFGWTLAFAIPWGKLAALGAVVVTAGTLVAYGVGRRGSHLAADRGE